MTLLATSASFVLVILDTSIVNVALESISQDLATDVTGLQWIATTYVVAFASLLLSGGALGDIFGARTIYAIGLVLFTMASLIAGCASSMSTLIAGRIDGIRQWSWQPDDDLRLDLDRRQAVLRRRLRHLEGDRPARLGDRSGDLRRVPG